MVAVPFEETYGYIPTKYVTIIFLILFSISTTFQARQWIRFPIIVWPILVCGILEIMGWASRLASSLSLMNVVSFNVQLVTTLIGPTPLGQIIVDIIRILADLDSSSGELLSLILTYLATFSTTVAFFTQIAGGAQTAESVLQGHDPSSGGVHVMFAGTVLHLATLSLQCIFLLCFFIRHVLSGGKLALRSTRVKLILGLTLALACVLIRTCYRVAELMGGLRGKLATTEVYFNVFDGTMIIVAMATLNFVVPRFYDLL